MGIVEDGLPDSPFRALIQSCNAELVVKVGAQVLKGTPLAAAAKGLVEETISAHLESLAKVGVRKTSRYFLPLSTSAVCLLRGCKKLCCDCLSDHT